MVRHTTDDQTYNLVIELTCRRCSGTSTIAMPERIDPDDFDAGTVFACPNCFHEDAEDPTSGETTEGYRFTLGDTYDVGRVIVTPDTFDVSKSIDEYEEAYPEPLVTPTMFDDFVEVTIRGKTYRERAEDRGVTRGTIGNTVARAKSKIRGEEAYPNA